ncbi:MAG: glycosyltransferase [Pontibacterium sp.]
MKIAIVNRSFWPIYPVIGEALLQLSEKLAKDGHDVSVIMQDHVNIRQKLKEANRGSNVSFYPAKALTTSSSSVARRAIDALFFAFWVLYTLVRTRPKRVYVSTDPPVTVPFIVMLYCWLFRASYIYHLQDIHPEATSVVFKVPRLVFGLLKKLDQMTMRRASRLITLTPKMKEVMQKRMGVEKAVLLIDNPSISFDQVVLPKVRKAGFTFCGNAGRLQRMPLLIEAIEAFINAGGKAEFVFAGGGVYASELEALSQCYEQVIYQGKVSPAQAAQINADYQWALLPIEDEVTKYAFPSKSSSYVLSGASVLAVCGSENSVADWIRAHKIGVVVDPDVATLSDAFMAIETGRIEAPVDDHARARLAAKLSFDQFVSSLYEITLH